MNEVTAYIQPVSRQVQGRWFKLPVSLPEVSLAIGVSENVELELSEIDSELKINYRKTNLPELNYFVKACSEMPTYVLDNIFEIQMFINLSELLEIYPDIVFYNGVDGHEELGVFLVNKGIIKLPSDSPDYIDYEEIGAEYALDNVIIYGKNGAIKLPI